jgi:hypothetical protein
MAYTPTALSSPIIAGGDTPRSATSNSVNRWYYNSPTDNLAACQASGYFSDAADRGMLLNDIVEIAVAGALKTPTQYVSAINSTTGAATISSAA